MKALETYNIKNDDWFCYQSKLCGVACALDHPHTTQLSGRINELAQSYFNQWQFVIRTYEKLFILLQELNSTQDKAKSGAIFSEYDIQSVEKEKEFRDYAYLLIISMKTFLDLFACLIEITLTKQIAEEHKMIDFGRIGKFLKANDYDELYKAFTNYSDAASFPWISQLTQTRNKLVHRGYHIKPKFSFSKSNDINFVIYKGNDMYFDVTELQMGDFFNAFMEDFPKMEDEVSRLLLDIVKEQIEIPLVVSYRYSELVTEFTFKEIL